MCCFVFVLLFVFVRSCFVVVWRLGERGRAAVEPASDPTSPLPIVVWVVLFFFFLLFVFVVCVCVLLLSLGLPP